jgi:hypothetical protein
MVSQMRIKRQGGRYRVSARDPRVLIECAPGEVGDYDMLWEGIDNDGDSQINEDPRDSVLLSNDFAIRWSDKQQGSNRFPMLTAESRALADFFVAHPNIACAINLRSLGGALTVASGTPQAEAPAGRGRRSAPQGDANRDKQVAEALQKLFVENTGFKPKQGEEPEGEGAGNVADWLYEACGAASELASNASVAAITSSPMDARKDVLIPSTPRSPWAILILPAACSVRLQL